MTYLLYNLIYVLYHVKNKPEKGNEALKAGAQLLAHPLANLFYPINEEVDIILIYQYKKEEKREIGN